VLVRALHSVLAAGLVFGCSPTIPPPVRPSSSAAADDQTAAPNPANTDPHLKPAFGPFDVQTVFYIAKSNDKDRVDYGMRLDEHCAPVGDDAVFPYWRILRLGAPVRSHPLKFLQYVAYGIAKQHALKNEAGGAKYALRLKQVDREMLIVSKRDQNSHCVATAYTKIQNIDGARLDYIFAKVAGPMSVDYVDVHGTDMNSGQSLVERLKP
jgi:hypothetical protein